jgi:autotransporter-associated beta strand protein
MQGASLTVVGKGTLAGGGVQGGDASAGGTNGQAFGGGIFLEGIGEIVLSPGKGQTERIANAIDDEAGVAANGYTPPAGFTPGSYGLFKSGKGTLILSADNAYSGATTVKAGTLIVNGSIIHSATTVHAHATLAGNGTTGDVTVLGGGFLSPGSGTAILHIGSVVLDPHAHFVVQLAIRL